MRRLVRLIVVLAAAAAAAARHAALRADDAAQQRVPLVVEVAASDGKPVRGAAVALFAAEPSAPPTARIDGRVVPAERPESAVAASTTDDAGRAKLDGLVPAVYRVVIESPSLARVVDRTPVARGVPATPLRAVARPGLALRGTARRKDGTVVAGVTVIASPQLDPWDDFEPARCVHATTDARGAYALDGLAKAAYDVWTWRTSHGFTWIGTVGVASPRTLDIPAPDGGTLRARVVAKETGAPLAGAAVEAWDLSHDGDGVLLGRGTSGADGVCEIRTGRADARVDVVTVWSSGRAPGIFRDPKHVLADGATAAAEYAVPLARTVAGTVSGPDGPVAGARVRVLRENLQPWERVLDRPEAVTDAAGRFVLHGIREGPLQLAAVADGFARGDVYVTVRGGPVAEYAIKLRRPAASEAMSPFRAAGVVLLPTGEPAAGAHVVADRGRGHEPSIRTATAADGTFELQGSAPGGSLFVVAARRGFASLPIDAGDARDLVLRMDAFASVRGTVRSELGADVAGARVVIGQLYWTKGGKAVDWHSARGARVREDGTYEVFLPRARHSTMRGPSWSEDFVVAVLLAGHAPAWSAPFTTRERMDAQTVDVVLGAGHTLRGRITRPKSGAPLAGAPVGVMLRGLWGGPQDRGPWPPVWGPGETIRRATTAADGSFAVPLLSPGAYEVWIDGPPPDKWPATRPQDPAVESPTEFRLRE